MVAADGSGIVTDRRGRSRDGVARDLGSLTSHGGSSETSTSAVGVLAEVGNGPAG